MNVTKIQINQTGAKQKNGVFYCEIRQLYGNVLKQRIDSFEKELHIVSGHGKTPPTSSTFKREKKQKIKNKSKTFCQ